MIFFYMYFVYISFFQIPSSQNHRQTLYLLHFLESRVEDFLFILPHIHFITEKQMVQHQWSYCRISDLLFCKLNFLKITWNGFKIALHSYGQKIPAMVYSSIHLTNFHDKFILKRNSIFNMKTKCHSPQMIFLFASVLFCYFTDFVLEKLLIVSR